MSSALWPIVLPVERSAIAGGFGARSFGRTLENAFTLEGMSLAALASIRISTKRSEYVIGGLDNESAPPAMTMSASPRRIDWEPLTKDWVEVAHARDTENASTVWGKGPASTISRAMLGAATSATTVP